MKQAILAVSFGTSHDDTREKTIGAIERDIQTAFPEYELRRAFTSGMILKSLQKRGISIDNVQQALEKLAEEGIERLCVQPTHVINGEEYDRMMATFQGFQDCFPKICVGAPLLNSTEDYRRVISGLMQEFPLRDDQALVFMGHGTEHFINSVYAALDYMMKDAGHSNVFVGTVEAYPDLDTVIRQVKKTNARQVLLTPLMVVAGDHAVNDMASDDPESWKSAFQKEGYQVECVVRGLGEYPFIRDIYLDHVKKALNS